MRKAIHELKVINLKRLTVGYVKTL